jgi:hypothetical protein
VNFIHCGDLSFSMANPTGPTFVYGGRVFDIAIIMIGLPVTDDVVTFGMVF